MYFYKNNYLNISSDIEIIELNNSGEDADVIISLDNNVVNIEIDNMPDYLSDRIQLTEVKTILIRFSLKKDHKLGMIHFLRVVDLNTPLMNFEIDLSGIEIIIRKEKFNIKLKINYIKSNL